MARSTVMLRLGVSLLFLVGCGERLPFSTRISTLDPSKIVDLSHAFDPATIYWPTEEGFVLEKGSAGKTDKGYFYAANRMRLAEHGGTHIDAPYHFFEAGQKVDEIPLDRLIGEGIVVDVEESCKADPDHRISISDFESWEKLHGPILEGSIVLLKTGYGKRWSSCR